MGFIFNQNAGETPETIAQKRKIADALASQAVSTAPMQSWTQGLAQVVAALGSKYQSGKANAAETAGREGASSNFNSIVDAVYGGKGEGVPTGHAPAPAAAPNGFSTAQFGNGDLKMGIEATAKSLGINPMDLATAISYETAGTFDPAKAGPTTQWGQHRGLIQFGEPQAKQYGVDWNNPVGSQLGPNGAVAKYLKDAGVQPGMGLMDVYSAINAGHVGKYNASDANNGGAPGTVADKVNTQMAGHRANAEKMFGTGGATVQPAGYSPGAAQQGGQLPMAQIIELMGNPYLNEGQQGILAQIVKQKMATGEWTKLNDGTMFNNLTGETHAVDVPRAPMTVGPGASVYNPNTGEAEFTSPAAPKSLRTEIKDIGGRSVLVNMDTGETIKDLGASPVKQKDYPAGYEASPDGNGMRRIPGYRDSNLEMDMRKEFDGLTKDFRQVRDSYNRIQASSEDPTPAGDLSLIFNYMKMLDPGSVVRESEFAVAANAAPLLTRYGLDPEKLKGVWQGQKLTPEQRADFLSRAESLYGEQDQTFQTLADQYTATAARNGLDPANIILTPRANPRKKRKAAPVTINGYQIIEEQ